MKTKKCWVIILFLLILAVVVVLADTICPTKEEYRVMVKAATNDYFTSPTYEKLMHLQDMLKVYSTHDFTKCLEEDDLKFFETGEKTFQASSVQTCSDDISYGSCSVNKPLYCDNGELVELCSVCGCNQDYECQADGSCVLLTCSDGTLYNQCSQTKPLFCEDGNLINKCTTCNCPENQVCQENNNCVNKTEAKDIILLILEADKLILKADKLIAEIALETAENTPIKHPQKYEKIVNQEIARAKEWLNKANTKTEQGNYANAVDDYKKSWEHSQQATKFANKEKPEEHPVITIIKKIVKVIVIIVKTIINFFKKLFRW